MNVREEDFAKLSDATHNEVTPGFPSVERRSSPRVPVFRPVMYESEGFGETRSRILDLSTGGAYIESPVVPEGNRIEMEFSLIEGSTVRAMAVVRYVMLGSGMGVEFEHISEKDREQISMFVAGFRARVPAQATHD